MTSQASPYSSWSTSSRLKINLASTHSTSCSKISKYSLISVYLESTSAAVAKFVWWWMKPLTWVKIKIFACFFINDDFNLIKCWVMFFLCCSIIFCLTMLISTSERIPGLPLQEVPISSRSILTNFFFNSMNASEHLSQMW